jgi:hypothetical protein
MKLRTIMAAAEVSLASLAFSCAQQAPVRESRSRPESAQEISAALSAGSFVGDIDKINKSTGMVTVQHWPVSKSFKVAQDCIIIIPDKADAKLDDLRIADPVVVSYADVGGLLVANRIERRSNEYLKERRDREQRLEDMINPDLNQPSPNR